MWVPEGRVQECGYHGNTSGYLGNTSVTMVTLVVTMVTLAVTMVTLILSVPGVSTATEHHTRNSSAWTQL